MAQPAGATAHDARLDGRTKVALVALAIAVLVVANDFTSLSVALPAIEQDFGADVTSVQWVMNAYALVFGVLIVPGGRLADIYGRRRMFFVGAVIFAVFSLLGGFAPELWRLIGCRALMGIGGALMWPSILGMTYGVLPPEKAGLAGGLILGAAGFGNAVGPLIGGALADTVGWEWIFFLDAADRGCRDRDHVEDRAPAGASRRGRQDRLDRGRGAVDRVARPARRAGSGLVGGVD